MTRGFWLLAALACSSPAPTNSEAGTDAGLRIPELGPVPALPTFADDPITPAKMQLGNDLFFDARLSGSGHTSCNACHIPLTSFQDNLPLSTPDRSYPSDSPTLTRSTLSFLNIVYAPIFRWEGSFTDLVQVMAFPFAEPNMNVAELAPSDPSTDIPTAQQALYTKLTTELTGYRAVYQAAFGEDIMTLAPADVWTLTGRALRVFATQAISRDAPFDRWNAGDDTALNASALRGLALFQGAGRCIGCHSGPFFTDFGFHNLSTSPPGPDGTRADEGHYDVTGLQADRGTFLTPTLRQAYDTSPYFHDGSAAGLASVLQHLSSPAVTVDPNHDPLFDTPLALSDDDMTDLISFIQSLRGQPLAPINPPTTFP